MLKQEELLLKKKAKELRISILNSIFKSGKGHIGGSFSIVEILVTLYYGNFLKYKPSHPEWDQRDKFILSKGHAGIAQYAVLADLGFFDKSELSKLNSGSLLGEHPDNNIPGIEFISGSLGHGLAIGCGIALANKINHQEVKKVFILLGDGECYEGSIWESLIFANTHELKNLCAIVDRNRLITHGSTEEINKLEPFKDKWIAFGWNCIEVDGHDFNQISEALDNFRNTKQNKPTVIISNSVKGKGISFMEDQAKWHHGGVDNDIYRKAINELMGDI
tara:strand:- start:1049 stop:1879 length:831 start_codon:yes stop_codon:yes gene_type:complete